MSKSQYTKKYLNGILKVQIILSKISYTISCVSCVNDTISFYFLHHLKFGIQTGMC